MSEEAVLRVDDLSGDHWDFPGVFDSRPDAFVHQNGALTITRHGEYVAGFAPGAWVWFRYLGPTK